jgi:hypothetical protein
LLDPDNIVVNPDPQPLKGTLNRLRCWATASHFAGFWAFFDIVLYSSYVGMSASTGVPLLTALKNTFLI